MGNGGNRRGRPRPRGAAANDNPGSASGEDGGPEARIEAAAMTLARLLGRQIAREEFTRIEAANDNAPTGEAGEGRERP